MTNVLLDIFGQCNIFIWCRTITLLSVFTHHGL